MHSLAHAFTHVYVCVYVYVLFMHTHRGQKGLQASCSITSLPYSPETGSLTELRTRLMFSVPQGPSSLWSPQFWGPGMCYAVGTLLPLVPTILGFSHVLCSRDPPLSGPHCTGVQAFTVLQGPSSLQFPKCWGSGICLPSDSSKGKEQGEAVWIQPKQLSLYELHFYFQWNFMDKRGVRQIYLTLSISP